jgi:nitrite reductase/ring-hydroxylating ferredoxin subunit/alkylhydroperoxidase/carboxymuconolactone decarboxylase family protein YurZ
MSKALEYLVKTRPEAMGHYFRFLKEAGSRLDPKTRSLISVITKVHAQTERGLKQYAKRALADGATSAEILDALLMAFPALGLAKIVWAIDVLIEAGIPGFSLDEARAAQAWHRVGEMAAIREGVAARVQCDGRSLFVHRANDGCSVYDSHCPHQGTDIPLEALDGVRLKCPKHGWTFDVASGACVSAGDRPLRRYPVKIEAGVLYAEW